VACVVAVAMMLLAGYTLRPLRVLREGAQVIGRGNYAHRVKIAAPDEIGDLAREFNAMAGAIEERESRLIESERIAARSERLATVGRLAAQITPEVRNPLSAIQLNTEMLDEEIQSIAPAAGGEARALLSAIQREVDRLTEVTEAYLQFARLPRPRLEVEDLAAVIQGTTSFVEAELAASGVALAVDLAADLPRLLLDENQIRQALLNLLRNAREAMSGGGTVTVSAHRLPGGGVELVVGDSGCGMPPEQLQKVFDPFFTTKEKGTGLGLTVTSQIIGEHGGTIEAESQPGQGTRFVIRLPAPDPGTPAGVA
jgi:signal transduction histidine kinase